MTRSSIQQEAQRETQLPHPYPKVEALAKSVTAGLPTVYAKVQALISWIGAHTRYSTDIPPLPKGADAVNEFLFGNRVGYCEQISTALTVMLRTLGIPAREAVGYVPGPYDPITDLYDIQASDAHAWVQVWFPYYGWQSFDPTAVVPLANPSPAHVLLHDVADILGRAPWVPVGIPLVVLFAAAYGVRVWRRRPQTWAEQVSRRLGRLGARARSPRRPGETLTGVRGASRRVVRRPLGNTQSCRNRGRGRRVRPARATTRGARRNSMQRSGRHPCRACRTSGSGPGSVPATLPEPASRVLLTPPAAKEPDRMSHRR